MMQALFFILGFLEVSKAIPGYSGAVTGPELSLLVIAATSAALAFLRSATGVSVPKPTYIAAACVALLLCSVFHAFSPDLSNRDFIYSISLSSIFAAGYMKRFALSNALKAVDVGPTCFAYALGVATGITLPYALGILGIVASGPMYIFAGRYQGFLEHPNQLGIACTFVVILAMTLRINLFQKLALLAPTIFVLFLSGSKFNIALSLFIVTAGSSFLITPGRVWMKSLGAALGISIALALLPLIAQIIIDLLMQINPREANRLAQFIIAPDRSESATDRLFIWSEGIRGAIQHLPLGVGLNNAPIYLKGLNHAHNLFIHYSLVWGIPGIVFVCSITFFCIQKFISSSQIGSFEKRDYLAFIAATAAMIATSLSSDSLSVTVLPLMMTTVVFIISKENSRAMRPRN